MSTHARARAAVRQVAIGGRPPRRPPVDGGPLVVLTPPDFTAQIERRPEAGG